MRDAEDDLEIIRTARRGRNGNKRGGLADLEPNDFYGYMLEHEYIFAPTGEIWPASSIDARLPAVETSRPRPGSTRTAPSSR
jgi:hypothetical protein